MKLYLVRHAIKEKAIGDVPITNEGIKQAQKIGNYFKNVPLTRIYSSPLKRAQETAYFTANMHGLPIIIDTRLRERANWGDIPGQSFHSFIEEWERCTIDPDYVPLAGDSARQASDRMCSLIHEISDQQTAPNDNVLLVTHGGLITDYLVNSFTESILNQYHPQFISNQTNLVSECSITILTSDKKTVSINKFACTDHL